MSPRAQQVAAGLNAIGVTPRDMMAIFQAMKQADEDIARLVIANTDRFASPVQCGKVASDIWSGQHAGGFIDCQQVVVFPEQSGLGRGRGAIHSLSGRSAARNWKEQFIRCRAANRLFRGEICEEMPSINGG